MQSGSIESAYSLGSLSILNPHVSEGCVASVSGSKFSITSADMLHTAVALTSRRKSMICMKTVSDGVTTGSVGVVLSASSAAAASLPLPVIT